jgi:HlyD family secretion protein
LIGSLPNLKLETRNQKLFFMNKFWKITLIVLAVLIVAAGAWFLFSPKPPKPPVYDATPVTRGSLQNSVTATGTVEPVTQVEVGTQVSGIVSHLYADYNSVVKKGQLIAELDKTNLLNDLASKKSNLAVSKTEYEYQQKNYNRTKTLYEKQMVSESDYETAYYNYNKAKNNYDIAKIQLATAQTNLSYATIYSPIDGVVLSRAVEEGQTVNAGMNTPTLFNIAADLTDMRVVADVDEADIGEVREGQRVTFTVDAYPTAVFEGTVQQVRQEATTTSNVVTYEVVVTAPNPDLRLKPGMTANITIYTLERNDVLVIPAKALKFTPSEDCGDTIVDCTAEHKVWVPAPGIIRAVSIEIGVAAGSQVEVVSGLEENELVLTGTATQASAPVAAEGENSGERSPFMPGPPGHDKKK